MVHKNSRVNIVSHPVILSKITTLRDKNTNAHMFRELIDHISTYLIYQASNNVSSYVHNVQTPIAEYEGLRVASPLVFPILRAGLTMLNAFLNVFPDAKTGFLGVQRNEETAEPDLYYKNFPVYKDVKDIFILDPMIATGGSLCHSIEHIINAYPNIKITVISIVANPKGCNKILDINDNITIFSAAYDEVLNKNFFIVPGLGDAGDRAFNS